MKNGGGTPAARFREIRFLHLLAGAGDFEGGYFRIRALIESAKRKRWVNQRLPLSPEMLHPSQSELNRTAPTDAKPGAA